MKELPSIAQGVETAKQSLQACKTKSSNLYNDFGRIIGQTLTERPCDVVDIIEGYIDNNEQASVFSDADIQKQSKTTENEVNLFSNELLRDETVVDQDEEFEIPIPNSLHMAYFFEQAGVGLSREEIYKISLSMKSLVYTYPLQSARFWGKLFGTEKSYYIAEVEFRDGEGEEEMGEDEDEEEKSGKENEEEANTGEDGPAEENNLPVNTWKAPPPIIKEDHKSGANKYVYFVCNEPGERWEKLPHVSPAEIQVARQIDKFFTGHLDRDVIAYPPFPGNEANYLRAQIARISASTTISPAGYFIFDEDEEEEEEEELHESYMPNSEFEGLSISELVDPSMASWAHHNQYILPQGRCTWYNPYEQPEDDFEEEEEEEEEHNLDQNIIPESGPSLLASVSDDKGIGSVPAWSTYPSSRVLPEYAVAVARSNIWPGAYAIAKESVFENIYVGWGKKYSAFTYAPPQPPLPQDEYPLSQEIQEALDPTVQEEKEFEDRKDANKASEEMEEEEIDDDDDDD